MTELEQYNMERNEALLSLDEAKIRAHLKKWDSLFHDAPSYIFWGGVHKAITGCLSLPLEFRKKSKAWLDERGFQSLDDGDLTETQKGTP